MNKRFGLKIAGCVKASGCDLSECRLELGEHVRFGPFRGSISNFRRSFSF